MSTDATALELLRLSTDNFNLRFMLQQEMEKNRKLAIENASLRARIAFHRAVNTKRILEPHAR